MTKTARIALIAVAALSLTLMACTPSVNKNEEGAAMTLMRDVGLRPPSATCAEIRKPERAGLMDVFHLDCTWGKHKVRVVSAYASHKPIANVSASMIFNGKRYSRNCDYKKLADGTWFPVGPTCVFVPHAA